MSGPVLCTIETYPASRRRIFGSRLRSLLALIGAIGIGLLTVGVVVAATHYQGFHATEEQIHQGIGFLSTLTNTHAADSVYRVVQEEYVSSQSRTRSDEPADFTSRATYTGLINFTPYTMPAEGGFIHQIGIYIFEVGNGTTQFRLALYEDTEGLPRLLLAQSDPLTATSTGWLWFDIEPTAIPGGTRYWLAYQATDDSAKLGWLGFDPTRDGYTHSDGYRYRNWSWSAFPSVAGRTWGPVYFRTCYQIAYTATRYALDAEYTVSVPSTWDGYTLTVRGATSGEPFTVTADGQMIGMISYTPTSTTFFSDDMESGVGGWTTSKFTHTVTDSGHYSSPTHVWWTPDVPYSSTASLTSVPITLPFNARNLELQFWHRVVAEFGWDGAWLEYRVRDDGGTWQPWSDLTDTMFIQGQYNSLLANVPSGAHWGWSSNITDVVRVQVPITTAGHATQWRWVFECDPLGGQPATQPDGWWIDDVRVFGRTSENTTLALSVPMSMVSDGQVAVRFQDTLTNTYPDLLGIDLIEVTGTLHNRPPTVTVTSPNGGEYWSDTRTIEWSGSDPNWDVITYNVYLSTDGGSTWSSSLYQVSHSETDTPATRSWTGFDTTAFANSENCLVRIEASDGDAGASDRSNTAFTIDNADPGVSLSAPNGGQLLRGGSNYTVTWNASDTHFGPTPISLYYSADGGATFPNLITGATENDGSYVWTIPALDSTSVRVRVVATDLAGNSAYDDSDGNFTVDSTAPAVTLNAPNGGEMLRGNSTYTITWSASDAHLGSTPIAIYYSSNGGSTFTTIITTATENDGSYVWTVPTINNASVRVRVVATDLVGNSGYDDSNGNFTVDSTAPSVTLSAPNGGEMLRGGSNYTITWSASDTNLGSTPVALYYSADGGATFPNTIVAATQNDGSHVWSVPALNTATVRVRVVVTDLAGNSNRDDSNGNLTVDSTAPSVTLVAPNGGETLRGGSNYTVTWNASDANFGSTPIALYYSTDGGATFPNTIIAATQNDGSHVWSVPALNTATVRVRVVATDLAGNSNRDDSDANLTIDSTAPSVTLVAPDGGEIFYDGDSCNITWSASDTNFGSAPIALYYSTDGGATFPNPIVTATENDGSYAWTIPALDSIHVRVRVVATDLAGNSTYDDSDANFTINSTLPEGTVAIAEGDYTNSATVHLALHAPDDTTEMYLDGEVADAPNVRQWVAYTTATTVTLTAGEESKTVTVRYRDAVGGEGSPASDSIVYDVTPPTITGATPAAGSTITTTATPLIGATLTDTLSGIHSTTITMTVDGKLVAHTYNVSSGAVSYTPGTKLANGSHTVAISVRDQAGNPASSNWSFTVDATHQVCLPFVVRAYTP